MRLEDIKEDFSNSLNRVGGTTPQDEALMKSIMEYHEIIDYFIIIYIIYYFNFYYIINIIIFF